MGFMALRELQLWRTVRQKTYSSYCNSILSQTGEASAAADGRSHRSDEVAVMAMERRASVIRLELFLYPSSP